MQKIKNRSAGVAFAGWLLLGGLASDGQNLPSLKQVPVLCYHHIRALAPGKTSRDYEVTPGEFAAQMKALATQGYKTVLPDQLYRYLKGGSGFAASPALPGWPSKPIIISFDDTDAEQYTVGKTEMEKYGFKGVFFIMTISIGRPHYLTREQIKALSDAGNTICCHTWDHHMVTKYSESDWTAQLIKPRRKLEDLIGKKIVDFAYPFGLWNQNAIDHLKKNGIRMAFQLSAKQSQSDPLYTVRRILVPGSWSVDRLLKAVQNSF